ncbi:hypothetical protein MNV_1240003 [Candidatus Methanoperedens nitroreducens]|uniref:Uncharacterized protein n=1 Tax=Candidatus Methanoperedens nitratireducens TaxID=1392998 RepID=A0A284VK14_9EURY|nr:hypothetical protein MNV_1240003 [Candidatus Methanoperedens nitroreducens]
MESGKICPLMNIKSRVAAKQNIIKTTEDANGKDKEQCGQY